MTIQGKTVNIFKAENTDAPLVILNNYMKSNGEIYKKCRELGCPDFTLAEISGLNWDDDMSPWAIPPISENDTPCGGKADEYLTLLLNEIIPAVKTELNAEPKVVCSRYTPLQNAICSRRSPPARAPCGSPISRNISWNMTRQSCREPSTFLSVTEKRIPKIKSSKPWRITQEPSKSTLPNMESTPYSRFELNKGNHFQQGALRTAKGIKWILEASK